MQKQIAIILSGCGVFDGSEINETVLTLLAIEQADVSYQAFAPNIDQKDVINHHLSEPMQQSRNVLIESARLVRGNIKDLCEADAEDFDGLIIPGGFGAAKNLCDFALSGAAFTVHPEVEKLVHAMHSAGKPVGFLCIAPVMIAKLYPAGTKLTIGNDAEIASIINQLGAQHVDCAVEDIVTDYKHKVVSTPAYMLAKNIVDAQQGIGNLVEQMLELML